MLCSLFLAGSCDSLYCLQRGVVVADMLLVQSQPQKFLRTPQDLEGTIRQNIIHLCVVLP